jgi:hypothetical protein
LEIELLPGLDGICDELLQEDGYVSVFNIVAYFESESFSSLILYQITHGFVCNLHTLISSIYLNSITDIKFGRQATEKRVVSQDLELWLSNV